MSGPGRKSSGSYPLPGGSSLTVLDLAPAEEEFQDFIRTALPPWSDPDDPGMHRSPTLDYVVVLEGTVGLELDNGLEVTLGPGDVVVQNGTRHRWHNRGTGIARTLSVCVGAHHARDSGTR